MRTNQMITKDPPKGKRFDLLAILSIGHLRVPKTLTFKMRPSTLPFL